MLQLVEFLQKTFEELSKQVPGFISVTLLKADDGTVMASYPPESKRALELISPFHLEIYKGSARSLDTEEDADVIKEIIISTEKRLYILASRSQTAVGVLTLDINKANLGITRKYSEKMANEIYEYLKGVGFGR